MTEKVLSVLDHKLHLFLALGIIAPMCISKQNTNLQRYSYLSDYPSTGKDVENEELNLLGKDLIRTLGSYLVSY